MWVMCILTHTHTEPISLAHLREDTHTACVLWARFIASRDSTCGLSHKRTHTCITIDVNNQVGLTHTCAIWERERWQLVCLCCREHVMCCFAHDISLIEEQIDLKISNPSFPPRKWTSTQWSQKTCPSPQPSVFRSSAMITSTPWSPISTLSSPSVTRRQASPLVRVISSDRIHRLHLHQPCLGQVTQILEHLPPCCSLVWIQSKTSDANQTTGLWSAWQRWSRAALKMNSGDDLHWWEMHSHQSLEVY